MQITGGFVSNYHKAPLKYGPIDMVNKQGMMVGLRFARITVDSFKDGDGQKEK